MQFYIRGCARTLQLYTSETLGVAFIIVMVILIMIMEIMVVIVLMIILIIP